MNCVRCGAPMEDGVCSYCGHAVKVKPAKIAQSQPIPKADPDQAKRQQKHNVKVSPKSRAVAFYLCLFFGYLGIHRFYLGKVGSAILYMFTFGCFGVGWLIDFILIAFGEFSDGNGLYLNKS